MTLSLSLFLSSSLLKKRKGASRHSSKSSLKSQPFYRRYKPILPTSLNYIDLNRPEAIHLGDLMRFLVRIDPNRSVIWKKKWKTQNINQKKNRVWNELHCSPKNPQKNNESFRSTKNVFWSGEFSWFSAIPQFNFLFMPDFFIQSQRKKNSIRAIRILRSLLSVLLGVRKSWPEYLPYNQTCFPA